MVATAASAHPRRAALSAPTTGLLMVNKIVPFPPARIDHRTDVLTSFPRARSDDQQAASHLGEKREAPDPHRASSPLRCHAHTGKQCLQLSACAIMCEPDSASNRLHLLYLTYEGWRLSPGNRRGRSPVGYHQCTGSSVRRTIIRLKLRFSRCPSTNSRLAPSGLSPRVMWLVRS